MPRVSEEYRAARRAEVVAAALAVVRRKGFQAASMADIIAESGMSAGAIYGYFRGKEEIVHEVGGQIVGARLGDIERLAATDPMPPPARVVEALARGMLDELGDTGILLQMWGEAVTEPALREFAVNVLDRLRQALADYIAVWQQREHGCTEAEAREIGAAQAPLFLAASQGLVVQHTLNSDFDVDTYLERITRYLPR